MRDSNVIHKGQGYKKRKRSLRRIPKTYLVVALVYFGSRWITYIGAFPFYLTDLLLIFALIKDLRRQDKNHLKQSTTAQNFLVICVTGLAITSTLRLIFSLDSGVRVEDIVRDFGPYIYLAVFFVTKTLKRLPFDNAESFALMRKMLILHLLWTSAAVLSGNILGWFQGLPGMGAGIFSVRPDFDSAIVSVLVGICLSELIRNFNFNSLFFLILGCATVFSLSTRAGLISLVVSLTVAILRTERASQTNLLNLVKSVVSIGAIALASYPLLSQSNSLIRLSATLGLTNNRDFLSASADGTQQARQLVWQGIFDWMNQTWQHQLFGSGFGNNFLLDSGTLTYLEGTTYVGVRSPHNWLVGVYARLGLVGVFFSLLIIVLAVFLALNRVSFKRGSEMESLAAFTVLAIVPVSLLGVVLEAPFGAILFFWAAGVLAGSNKNESITIPQGRV